MSELRIATVELRFEELTVLVSLLRNRHASYIRQEVQTDNSEWQTYWKSQILSVQRLISKLESSKADLLSEVTS